MAESSGKTLWIRCETMEIQVSDCGHTASVQEIMRAGAKDPNCAYMECIGRYQKDIGCNFAAYGFLGIPHGGYVIEDKKGIGMEIFEFADKVETN